MLLEKRKYCEIFDGCYQRNESIDEIDKTVDGCYQRNESIDEIDVDVIRETKVLMRQT